MIEFDKLIAMYLKYPDRGGDFVPVSDGGDSVSMLYYGQVGLSKARHLAFSMQISDVAYVASERQTILSELEMLESNRDDEYSDDLEDFEDTADILSASHDDAPLSSSWLIRQSYKRPKAVRVTFISKGSRGGSSLSDSA